MALQYGYFDSEITGYDDEGMPEFDRAQTSDFMADFFSKLISSGVLASPSTCFQVTAYDGMTVAIAPGYAFVRGRFAYDESTAYLTLDDAPTTTSSSRIDMIVLRANYEDRLCELVVKSGTAASSPEEPELLQPASGGDYFELCLAKITVATGVTEITQSVITDTRYLSSYCGAVAQLIDSIDATTLLAQFETQFTEWFEKMKDQLSDDAAGNLQTEIDDITAAIGYVEVEVPSSGWNSSAPYTQSVTVSGMTEDWIPGAPVLVPSGDSDTDLAALEAFAYVSIITSGEDTLTFTCYEDLPESDFTIRIPGLYA